MFVVKDSLGLISQPVLLKADDIRLLQLLNGQNTVQDIQLFFMRQQGGLLVSSESIKKRLDQYDSLFLLDSDAYRQAKGRIFDNFSQQSVRPASLAGTAYPDTKEGLKAQLDSFFEAEDQREEGVEWRSVRAIVSPHIDFNIGKAVYTAAYRLLEDLSPKKIFLFGTGHSLHDGVISLTEKDFATPLGLARTDKDIVRTLKEAALSAAAPNDFAHRSEHSIEFQILFLQHFLGDTFEIVPVLYGSFQELLALYDGPAQIPGMKDFLKTLRTILSNLSAEALCVAGVDFSHIGPKFGHTESSGALLYKTRAHDKRLIDAICRGDLRGFWGAAQREDFSYNVCGFSAMACLLEVLPRVKGILLDYDVWEEEPTRSAVSFAAIGLGD